jgi:hypothetical protein
MSRPVGSKNKIIHKKDLTYLQGACIQFIEKTMQSGTRQEKLAIVRDILPYVFSKRPASLEVSGDLTLTRVEVVIVENQQPETNIEQILENSKN